jgi:hypothetical protein
MIYTTVMMLNFMLKQSYRPITLCLSIKFNIITVVYLITCFPIAQGFSAGEFGKDFINALVNHATTSRPDMLTLTWSPVLIGHEVLAPVVLTN